MQAEDIVHGKTKGYDPKAHEEEPRSLTAGITIQNLTKVYDEVNFEVCVAHMYIYMYYM